MILALLSMWIFERFYLGLCSAISFILYVFYHVLIVSLLAQTIQQVLITCLGSYPLIYSCHLTIIICILFWPLLDLLCDLDLVLFQFKSAHLIKTMFKLSKTAFIWAEFKTKVHETYRHIIWKLILRCHTLLIMRWMTL